MAGDNLPINAAEPVTSPDNAGRRNEMEALNRPSNFTQEQQAIMWQISKGLMELDEKGLSAIWGAIMMAQALSTKKKEE